MTVQVDASAGVFSRRTGTRSAASGLLWICLVMLAGATLTSLLARTWWVFELSTHFRLHYVAAAVVLLLWGAAARRYVAAIVAATCGAVHALWLFPLFLGPGAVAATDVDGVDLRLATLNMLWNNPTPEQVIQVLDAYQPDIVALQETTPWWPLAPAEVLEAYPYRAPLAWELGRSVTLISRYPITAHQMRNGGGLRLQFPMLTIDVGGRQITVIAVHPPHPLRPHYARPRSNYLSNVAEAVGQADMPVIVLGDFNTTPFAPAFQDLLDATGLRNAADGFGYNPTWPVAFGSLGIPIDHVLVSAEFAVAGLQVGPRMGSDHAPLFVDVRLTGPDG